MIITKNWLNEWIDVENITIEEISEKLNKIGLEVDRVQTFSAPEGVVVGKIEEIEKHPDADKLRVCQIDIGTETLQIVTNDQNVQIDDFVPVATVGTNLPNVKIKRGKLRGVESLGMLCSTEEFGIPRVDEGVVILDNSIGQLEKGKPLSQFPIFNDSLIEIELTANRGDCLSIYGIARDLAVAFDLELKNSGKNPKNERGDIENLDYSLKYIDFSEVEKAPLFLRSRLAIVEKLKNSDIENILSYSTFSTGVIFKGVDKKDNFSLSFGDGVLESEISKVGIFTEISQKPSQIEVSYIDPEKISEAVFNHNLKKDEFFYNSSRGSEPDLNFGIEFLENLNLIKNLKKSFSNSNFSILKEITTSLSEIENFIGAEIGEERILNILRKLGFEVEPSHGNLVLKVPRWRHDILNSQDVTEEILRVVGIDNIPVKPLQFSEKRRENRTSKGLKLKRKLRERAISRGYFETLLYLFGDEASFQKYGFETVRAEKKLLNPIVHNMDTLRPTMVIGLLNAVERNLNFGKSRVPLFEIGRIFSPERDETEILTIVFSGEKEAQSVKNSGKPKDIDFETFSRDALSIIGGGELFETQPNSPFHHPYQIADIFKDGQKIGIIYKLRLDIAEEFNLGTTYIAEVEISKITMDKIEAVPYSKYQASERDLSVVLSKNIGYSDVKKSISEVQNPLIKEIFPIDIFQLSEDEVSLTLRFSLQSDDKTLQDGDITTVVDEVLKKLVADLKAELR
jgi:phenylalanyl-tRNA synthetase beta chain